MARRRLAYGTWPSPVTAEVVSAAATRPRHAASDSGVVWWSESRPAEGGRTVLMRLASDGPRRVGLDPETDVRTRVNEYGGAAWWLYGETVFYVDDRDQRIHRWTEETGSRPVTPLPSAPARDRWADGALSPDGGRLAAVRERHLDDGRVLNEVVVMPSSGGHGRVVSTGSDFVAGPRWSTDGSLLCWLEWSHPVMPWESTVLRVGDGLHHSETVAGGPGESVLEPSWMPDGSLWFLSDRTGWSNLYRWTGDAGVEPMVVMTAEIGHPPWTLGLSSYAMTSGGEVVFAVTENGRDALWVREPGGVTRDLRLPFTVAESIRTSDDGVVAVVAGPRSSPEVVRLRPFGGDWSVETISTGSPLAIDGGYVVDPEHLTFPTTDDEHAHALFYPPTSPGYDPLPDERPPLVLFVHGGPTSCASPALRPEVLYWTSRGFAVAALNYRGSTGYGRRFRDLLRHRWGVADVEDALSLARWLADTGRVDARRRCVRGGSSGGYTALCSVVGNTTFAAATSLYGVSDLVSLAADTHKFESHYLESLVGPLPAHARTYESRSPLRHADSIDVPLLILQGLDDKIVPPAQSTVLAESLRRRGLPVSYVAFEDEGHGFRKQATQVAALEAELRFYSAVLGLVPRDGEPGPAPAVDDHSG